MANGFTTDTEHAAKVAAYNAELVRRYEAGEYLTKADKKEARRLIKEAK